MAEENTPHDGTVEDAGRYISGLLEQADNKTDAPKETQEATQEDTSQERDEGTDNPETEDTSADTSDAEQEAEELRSLTDIAKRLGVNQEQLNQIRVQAKVNGQDTEATLHDLVTSYQLQGHLNRKSMELSEAQKQAEIARNHYQQQINERVQQLDNAILALHATYSGMSDEQLQKLKEEDPDQYLLERDKQRDLEAKIGEAFRQRQAWIQEQEHQQQEQMQEYLRRQQIDLLERIPDWKDATKKSTEQAQIRSYLASKGFDNQEIAAVNDARYVDIVRDAMLYRQLKDSKPQIQKRVAEVHKVQKPGTAQTKAEREQNHINAVKQRAFKSGSIKDMGNYFGELLKEAH